MERMVMSRLVYFVEKKGLFPQYQSGFRKGRSTMEAAIRKAQVKREIVVGVFFDKRVC